MNGNQVLTTNFRISELVNVGPCRTRHRACRTFPAGVVTQAFFLIESEVCFPQDALVNADDAVRTIMVVNRSLLAWSPADNQHFDSLIATNPVTPVIPLLESDVRLEIEVEDLDVRKPQIQLFKRWRGSLAAQTFNQFGKTERIAIGWCGWNGSFRIYKCRQVFGSGELLYSLRRLRVKTNAEKSLYHGHLCPLVR